MTRGAAFALNALALVTLGWLVADNGLPGDEEMVLFLVLLAAPVVSLIALLGRRASRLPEADPRAVLDFDDRLAALERAEQRRTEAEAR
ncbi:MAG: hypothetical protein AAF845_18590 [Bacteroidota bacterium]